MNTPLRYHAADAFLSSARDMGDTAMTNVAIEIYWQVRFPRTKAASETANRIYKEWKLDNGWA